MARGRREADTGHRLRSAAQNEWVAAEDLLGLAPGSRTLEDSLPRGRVAHDSAWAAASDDRLHVQPVGQPAGRMSRGRMR